MKKIVSRSIIVILVLFASSCTEPARFTVTTRMTTPVEVRPMSPGAGYIWIEGEWYWDGRNYAWRNGYWTSPHSGYNWRPGTWKQRRNGWTWRPGRWR